MIKDIVSSRCNSLYVSAVYLKYKRNHCGYSYARYILKQLPPWLPLEAVTAFHPLVRRERRTQTVAKGWDVAGYKGRRVRIESARFRENEIRRERERLGAGSGLCVCVPSVKPRGWKYKGLGETARSFRGCQECPQGNRRFPPLEPGARIIREFLEKEGSWWAIAVIKRPL